MYIYIHIYIFIYVYPDIFTYVHLSILIHVSVSCLGCQKDPETFAGNVFVGAFQTTLQKYVDKNVSHAL